jgi:UDP-N-acetylmuramate--alanine ligase
MSVADARAVHLIGAGGFGMAAFGGLLQDRGVALTGSDLRRGPGTARLSAHGARITIGPHRAETVPAEALVIASAAIPADNPELRVAHERGQRVLTYPQALGEFMRACAGVAIAGTHGKTTTTALVVAGARAAQLDPSFVVGGDVPQFAAAGHCGADRWFVAEACEYAESFLHLAPRVAAITNVEADHLDHYGSFERVVDAFRAFVARIDPHGVLITTPSVLARLGPVACATRTVGSTIAAMTRAVRIRDVDGLPRFDVEGDIRLRDVGLAIPGRHSVENAMVALGVLHAMGVDVERARAGIEGFSGVARRLEPIAEHDDVVMLSDYAHHPTALSAVADAIFARYPGRRVVAAFQPHQASRTRDFFAGFAQALARFHVPLVTDIYGARESGPHAATVTAAELAEAVRESNPAARYAGALSAVVPAIQAVVRPGDVVLLLGAGDIDDLRVELPGAVSSALRRRAP